MATPRVEKFKVVNLWHPHLHRYYCCCCFFFCFWWRWLNQPTHQKPTCWRNDNLIGQGENNSRQHPSQPGHVEFFAHTHALFSLSLTNGGCLGKCVGKLKENRERERTPTFGLWKDVSIFRAGFMRCQNGSHAFITQKRWIRLLVQLMLICEALKLSTAFIFFRSRSERMSILTFKPNKTCAVTLQIKVKSNQKH